MRIKFRFSENASFRSMTRENHRLLHEIWRENAELKKYIRGLNS